MRVTSLARPRVLILWNQVEEDIYERWREHGPGPLPWDPSRVATEVRTVREEMDDLIVGVRDAGYEVTCINVHDDIERMMAALRLYRPDVVFNLIEYLYNDEGLESSVVGAYEVFGYPYTGSPAYTLSLCQRKHHTKLLLQAAGLPTPPYFIVENLDSSIPDREALASLFPAIVKPAQEDASGGIEREAVVTSYPALVERVRYVLREFEQPALVEKYIEGREIHVAIIGNREPEILPLFEMLFDHTAFIEPSEWRPRIVSFSGKWDPLSEDFYTLEPICPALDLSPDAAATLGAIALRAYLTTGCRDYARVDMRVAENGAPYILEVNPNPDLTDGSAFIMCAQASGRTYSQTLGEIVEMAIARFDDEPADAVVVDGEWGELPTDHLNRKYTRPPDW